MITCFNEHNIAPLNADHIGVYNDSGKKVGEIEFPNSFKPNSNKKLYSVGLISDTHYNDIDVDFDPEYVEPDENTDSQFNEDIINALQFFKNEKTDLICSAGDITTDKETHFFNFKSVCETYSPNIPVYSCKGNHDNTALWGISSEFLSYIQKEAEKNDNISIDDICSVGDGTSFLMSYSYSNTIPDVYIFLNLDYGESGTQAVSNETDELITDEERTHQYYNPAVLDWFEEKMEEYKNHRVFVFTHLFFRQKAGNNNGKYYQYYSNGRSRKYTLRGQQFIRLNELNNKYVNSVWFTGHSHYPWEYQLYDKKINICDYDSEFIEGNGTNGANIGSMVLLNKKCDSAYNVHIPSLARPLKIASSYMVDYEASEGGIMDVYEDYIDIKGVRFKSSEDSDYQNKYLPIAIYRLYVGGKNLKQM